MSFPQILRAELKLDEMLETPQVDPFVTPVQSSLPPQHAVGDNGVPGSEQQQRLSASSSTSSRVNSLGRTMAPKQHQQQQQQLSATFPPKPSTALASSSGMTHTLKHKRHKVPLAPLLPPEDPMASSSLGGSSNSGPGAESGAADMKAVVRPVVVHDDAKDPFVASATKLLEQIQSMPFSPEVTTDIVADPHDLQQHASIVDAIKNHISLLKESLPTYADVLEDVSVVLCTTLSRNISRNQAALGRLKKKLLRDAMDRDTKAIRDRMKNLEETAASNAEKFAEYETWRRTRLVEQQQHVTAAKQEIDRAKSMMEARLQEIAQANERIAALYQRHLEARRFMNSVEDIQEREAEILTSIEQMSDHKNSLSEKFLELRESSKAELEAMRTEKLELESTIFQLRTKLSTVDRKVKVVRADLVEKELELKRQIQSNAGLRDTQQHWREKLAAREAFEWRAQTPRPAHDDGEHGLLPLVDCPRGSSSTTIVDTALKKLTSLTTATKKQFEELMRLSRVIRPLSSIVLYAQIDPLQGFRDNESDTIIVTPSSDLLSFISHAEHPVNEKWSQGTTERHALAMFKVLPIVPVTSNSPQSKVNEAVMKWCMAPEYNAPSFPANLLLSLRAYSRISPICRAGLLTLYAKLPLNFGDTVLQFFADATQSPDPQVPLRNMQAQLTKHLGKENSCLGTFFALQAKLAVSLDAAVAGGNVRIAGLTDIIENKRNSGLLLRTIFAHFLYQDQTIRQAIMNAALESSRSSLTTAKDVLVHEPTLRTKLEQLRWDPELFHGNGVRYGSTRHVVGLSVKVVADHMLTGLSRVDGSMHRLDEAAATSSSRHVPTAAGPSGKQQASSGSTKAGKDAASSSAPAAAASSTAGSPSGRKEYVHAEPLLAAINVVPIRLAEVKNVE